MHIIIFDNSNDLRYDRNLIHDFLIEFNVNTSIENQY